MSELTIINAMQSAIESYTYTTVWDKRVVYSDQFALSGIINRGAMPIVVFPNGITNDLATEASGSYSGDNDFQFWAAMAFGVVQDKQNRIDFWNWCQELKDAIKPVWVDEPMYGPSINFEETDVLPGCIVRTFGISYRSTECY